MAAQIQCDQGRSSVLNGLEFRKPAILGVPFLRMRIPSPSCGNVLNFLEGKYTVDRWNKSKIISSKLVILDLTLIWQQREFVYISNDYILT